MSYYQKLAQKLLDDLATTNVEIISVVLIDLHQGAAIAQHINGTIPLAAPDVVAQLVQLAVSHQTLDRLIDNGSRTTQLIIRRDLMPHEAASTKAGASDHLVWRWDVASRWLLVSHAHPTARLGLVLLDMTRMLDEWAKQFIEPTG